jgi:DNA polymerase-3 subunit delta
VSFKHFISEVEKGLTSPAYFLYAEDQYLLKEATHMIAGTIPESERAFSYDVFDLDGIDEIPPFEQILDVLNTVPFMGSRRVVVIENLQELSKKNLETLEDYVSRPSPQAVLVVLHLGSPKVIFRNLMKKIKSISLDMRQDELPLWIREKARRKGLVVTDEAIEYLLNIVGPEAGLLSSEMEKLALVGKTDIDVRDISDIVVGSSDYSVFDLVNALRSRDKEKVFIISRALQETQESYGLLGAINWHYSKMSAKDQARAAYYTKVFELLNEADIRVKTSGGAFPIEYLLIRLLQI